MTNAESKRHCRARRRGEDVPKLKPWGDTGKGVYKWPSSRISSWKGEGNPNWKGDNAKQGRDRAQRWYRLGPCEVCSSPKTERHHKDGNTLNNTPENIAILCRRHHMEADGRRARLIERITAQNKLGKQKEVKGDDTKGSTSPSLADMALRIFNEG